MCGIAGVIGDADVGPTGTLSALLQALEHRGRPGTQHEVTGFSDLDCALGTNRLPIVRPSANRQPARSPSGRYAVAMNGQIFNYESLATALGLQPIPGDVSVLAAALEAWGVHRTLPALVWEGAFLALDKQERRLFAARDHLGIKPLYSCQAGEKTWFASELKALSRRGDAPIHPVEPGTVVDISLATRQGTPTTWWTPPSRGTTVPDAAELSLHLDQLLVEAVRCRVPEGPYALLLSGGLDSSLVLRMALEQNDEVTAYVLAGPQSPDLPHARALCAELGVRLVEVSATSPTELEPTLPDVIQRLETWEWHVVNHAAPMDALLAAIRADGHKVALTGEGADELFFGYEDPGAEHDRARIEAEQIQRVQDLHRTNCRRLDRMGMSHGLECRVPFLDRRLTELALSLPSSASLGAGTNKRPLRDIARRWLPATIADRGKLSFARGAGYRYGRGSSQSVFGALAGAEGSELPSGWNHLPRYPLEHTFLQRFLEAGYGRAAYLQTRSR